MAGETPGASAAQQARNAAQQARSTQRRADNKFANDRNADKYYKSGAESVIDTVHGGDMSARPGTVPTPIPTPRSREGDRSADKYYRNGGSKGSTPPAARYGEMGSHLVRRAPLRTRGEGVGRMPDGPVPVSGTQIPVAAGSLFVGVPEHIQGVVHNAINVLEGSGSDDSIVTIEVPAGMKQLMRRTRALLDLMTTRTEISEAHAARIKLAYGSGAAAPAPRAPQPAAVRAKPLSQRTLDELLGPPVPKEAPPVSLDSQDAFDALLDPAAVLRGEVSLDEPVDTSPLPLPPVEPLAAPEVDADEDDGMPNLDPAIAEAAAPAEPEVGNPIDDVLAASAPEVEVPEVAPEVPQEAEAPKRRGKRSGRGS